MLKRKKKLNSSDKIPPIILADCIAKTVKISENLVNKGVDVFTHCLITGMVAKELIKRQPKWLQDLLFPEGSELLAAVHDVGKVFPSFQKTIYKALRSPDFPEGQELEINCPNMKIRHEDVSFVTFHKFNGFISEIIGRHHGYSPNFTGMPDDEIYGGSSWQKMRMELFEDLKRTLETELPIVKSEVHADVLSVFYVWQIGLVLALHLKKFRQKLLKSQSLMI